MLLLAKLAAIVVLVWFFTSAQEHRQPPVQWAVIGLIGYVLTWFLVYKTFVHGLPPAMTRSEGMGFIVMQFPVFCAMAAVYLVRKKLISDATNSQKQTSTEVE